MCATRTMTRVLLVRVRLIFIAKFSIGFHFYCSWIWKWSNSQFNVRQNNRTKTNGNYGFALFHRRKKNASVLQEYLSFAQKRKLKIHRSTLWWSQIEMIRFIYVEKKNENFVRISLGLRYTLLRYVLDATTNSNEECKELLLRQRRRLSTVDKYFPTKLHTLPGGADPHIVFDQYYLSNLENSILNTVPTQLWWNFFLISNFRIDALECVQLHDFQYQCFHGNWHDCWFLKPSFGNSTNYSTWQVMGKKIGKKSASSRPIRRQR